MFKNIFYKIQNTFYGIEYLVLMLIIGLIIGFLIRKGF